MPIVIRKRVALDFLGSRYKDSYLEFKSIPLKDYGVMVDDLEKNTEGKKAIAYMLKLLQTYFLEGKFESEVVTAEDLGDFDQQTAITIFEELTGQSPKAEGQLSNQSTTTPPPPES